MSVFHIFLIVQMVPYRNTHHNDGNIDIKDRLKISLLILS